METIVLKPQKELKTVWFIVWSIILALVVPLLVVLMLLAPSGPFVVLTVILLASLVVMSLVAIWIPAFLGSLDYAIDDTCVRSKAGVFWQKRVTIPFGKITHIDITQGPLERAFGIGTIHVQTAGAGGTESGRAELRILGLKDLDQIKEAIMARAGYQPTLAPPQTQTATGSDNVSVVLGRILHELTVIRRILEDRGP